VGNEKLVSQLENALIVSKEGQPSTLRIAAKYCASKGLPPLSQGSNDKEDDRCSRTTGFGKRGQGWIGENKGVRGN